MIQASFLTLAALAIAATSGSAQIVRPLSAPVAPPKISVVLCPSPPRLALFDDVQHALLGTFETHRNPAAQALNVELAPDGRTAYVLHTDDSVTRVDLVHHGVQPVTISPDPTSIDPFVAIAAKDLEMSPDGRYLAVTCWNSGAYLASAGSNLNRLSIYDLALGTAKHAYVDTTPNFLFPPRLDIAISKDDVAWIADGDLNACIAVDLKTGTTTHALQSCTPQTFGSASNLVVQTLDLALLGKQPCWLPYTQFSGPPYLRVADAPLTNFADLAFDAAVMFEVETGDSNRFVAVTRPAKTSNFTGPSPDRILLVDLLTGLVGRTPPLLNSHRFSEIEFANLASGGRVFGLDWSANTFLIADFSAFVADPVMGQVTMRSIALPGATIKAREASDGLLGNDGIYRFHDAKGALAWIDAQGTLLGVASSGLPSSVDMEIAGRVQPHRD